MNKLGRLWGAILVAVSLLPSAALPVLSSGMQGGIDPSHLTAVFNTGDAVVASSIDFDNSHTSSYEYMEADIASYADGRDPYAAAGVITRYGEKDGSITIGSRLWELLFGTDEEPTKADERPSLIVGGAVFGTRIKESKVTVTSPDEGGILHVGDKILSINGISISSINDVKSVLSESDGSPLHLLCKRGAKQISLTLAPKLIGDKWRLGAVLREGAAGLGTITYIDPKTGEFGGLGHGICDPDTGEIVEMSGGTVTDVIIGGVVKGEGGKPGELSGILTDRNNGEIYTNTDSGVFGRLTKIPQCCTEVLPIAHRNEVEDGKAKIISTLKNVKTM